MRERVIVRVYVCKMCEFYLNNTVLSYTRWKLKQMLNFYSTFAVLTDKMKKKNLFVFFAYSLPMWENVLVFNYILTLNIKNKQKLNKF